MICVAKPQTSAVLQHRAMQERSRLSLCSSVGRGRQESYAGSKRFVGGTSDPNMLISVPTWRPTFRNHDPKQGLHPALKALGLERGVCTLSVEGATADGN